MFSIFLSSALFGLENSLTHAFVKKRGKHVLETHATLSNNIETGNVSWQRKCLKFDGVKISGESSFPTIFGPVTPAHSSSPRKDNSTSKTSVACEYPTSLPEAATTRSCCLGWTKAVETYSAFEVFALFTDIEAEHSRGGKVALQ